jgi:hypothetical protein
MERGGAADLYRRRRQLHSFVIRCEAARHTTCAYTLGVAHLQDTVNMQSPPREQRPLGYSILLGSAPTKCIKNNRNNLSYYERQGFVEQCCKERIDRFPIKPYKRLYLL